MRHIVASTPPFPHIGWEAAAAAQAVATVDMLK